MTLPELLKSRQWTIAAAESLTAGLVQAKLADQSGASAFFEGGITAYSLSQKVTLLGVDASHASEVNCVSKHVAMQMAEGVRRRFGTYIGVATTGYAGAWPDEGVEHPFAWIAVCIGDHFIAAQRISGPRDESRTDFRNRVAETVLSWTYKLLQDQR